VAASGVSPCEGGALNAPSTKKVFIWAHRGASRFAPENTLAAFRAAEAAGADGIELDVHLTRDGAAVVIHDETVDRTTNGRGTVARLRLRELRRLDAGSWFGPIFSGERIPTLEEVFVWAGDRLRLNIELKTAEAAQSVLSLLGDHPRTPVLLSSFNHRLLEKIRGIAPLVPLGFLAGSFFMRRDLARAEGCRAESFHPRLDTVSKPLMETCHRHGMTVYPWTVDDVACFRQLRRSGADGVFTNDPAALVRATLWKTFPLSGSSS
jgi:glycerophosphoryl diester phosphodiesterase